MSSMEEQQPAAEKRPQRASGRDAKRAARAARAGASIPYITRSIPYFEVLTDEGLSIIEQNAETILAEYGIEFREDDEALAIWKAAGADVQGSLVQVPAWHVPRTGAEERAARVRAVRAQPGAQCPHRRQFDGVRPGLRFAVHPERGRGPPLRPHRRLPQFRQARLHGEFAAPLGWHDLRTGRPAGQQAPSRHGVQPHQVQRQAVHGLGHCARSARRTASNWRRSLSAPTRSILPPASRAR